MSTIRLQLQNERDGLAAELGDAKESLRDALARLDSANAALTQLRSDMEHRLREKDDELESIRYCIVIVLKYPADRKFVGLNLNVKGPRWPLIILINIMLTNLYSPITNPYAYNTKSIATPSCLRNTSPTIRWISCINATSELWIL